MPTLISTLLSLSLSGILMVGGMQVFFKYHYVLESRSALNKIDYTIALARSLAINSQQHVKICPSKENTWSYGWSIQSDGKVVKRIPLETSALIDFYFLKNKNGCLNILPDGMSHDNGHFTYTSRSLLYNIKEQLVFNKGLRTYVKHGDD